ANFLQLPSPLKQKEQLSLKCRCARILVEALEKRILIGLFQDELAAQRLPQATRQTGLADTNRTFDNNESVRYCAHHERLSCYSRTEIPSSPARCASSNTLPVPGIAS